MKTIEDYKKLIKFEEDKHSRIIRDINIRFARLNNPYKVGDIVEDHIGMAEIISWTTTISINSIPCLIYKCYDVRKDGKRFKNANQRKVFQSNIVDKED